MKKIDPVFAKFEDEAGEEYYCPILMKPSDGLSSKGEQTDCVEASTVGRYAGNLNVADRFSS